MFMKMLIVIPNQVKKVNDNNGKRNNFLYQNIYKNNRV